jgi:hypothetical protein
MNDDDIYETFSNGIGALFPAEHWEAALAE